MLSVANLSLGFKLLLLDLSWTLSLHRLLENGSAPPVIILFQDPLPTTLTSTGLLAPLP